MFCFPAESTTGSSRYNIWSLNSKKYLALKYIMKENATTTNNVWEYRWYGYKHLQQWKKHVKQIKTITRNSRENWYWDQVTCSGSVGVCCTSNVTSREILNDHSQLRKQNIPNYSLESHLKSLQILDFHTHQHMHDGHHTIYEGMTRHSFSLPLLKKIQ